MATSEPSRDALPENPAAVPSSARRRLPPWIISVSLMVGLTLCFAVQYVVVILMDKPYHIYIAVSGYGMKSGQLWELFTYQFIHDGWLHWLLNLVALILLGPYMEKQLGSRQFLKVYLGAVLVGGALQGAVAVTGFVLPESMDPTALYMIDKYGESAAGASVGLCGLLAVYCLMPTQSSRVARFPTKKVLLDGAFLAAIVLVIVPTDPRIAHIAHLGGLAAGLFFGLRMRRPLAVTLPISNEQ